MKSCQFAHTHVLGGTPCAQVCIPPAHSVDELATFHSELATFQNFLFVNEIFNVTFDMYIQKIEIWIKKYLVFRNHNRYITQTDDRTETQMKTLAQVRLMHVQTEYYIFSRTDFYFIVDQFLFHMPMKEI